MRRLVAWVGMYGPKGLSPAHQKYKFLPAVVVVSVSVVSLGGIAACCRGEEVPLATYFEGGKGWPILKHSQELRPIKVGKKIDFLFQLITLEV